MKEISQIVNEFKVGTDNSEQIKGAQSVINDIFRELKAAFPAWRSAIQSDDEERQIKLSWAKALLENKVNTHEQVKKGIQKARQSTIPYFPSVGQFIEWCNAQEPVKDASHDLFLPPPSPTDEEYDNSARRIREIRKELGL